MKAIYSLAFAGFILVTTGKVNAQNINWRAFEGDQKHVISVNIGLDYSASFGIGYGRKINTGIPIVLNGEFSTPAGKDLMDDLKVKLGGQSQVLKLGDFSTSVKAYGIIRKYRSEYVRMWNFGSEFSIASGYYKKKWFAAGEFGFDKAITTHIQNSEEMKSYFPGIKNGWFIPSGGNYFYGIQSGLSLKKMDANIRVGKTIAQGFETSALFPFYFQIGVNKRF